MSGGGGLRGGWVMICGSFWWLEWSRCIHRAFLLGDCLWGQIGLIGRGRRGRLRRVQPQCDSSGGGSRGE